MPGPHQATPAGTGYAIPDVARSRLRLRHYVLLGAFAVMVIVPMLVAVGVSLRFSGTLRQVTTSVTVQEHSVSSFSDGAGPGAALRSAFKSSGGEETSIVRQLIQSEDFFRTISDQLDLADIWPADLLVPYLPYRFDPTASVEQRHRFWRNMVVVHIGSRDAIIRLTVTAGEQGRAETLLSAIRAEAERRINLARTATLKSALADATARVAQMRARYNADRDRLLAFRLESKTIDPALLAVLNATFTADLRGLLAAERIRLGEISASVESRDELSRISRGRIDAMTRFLESGSGPETGVTSADEITAMIAQYEPLLGAAEASRISLRAAEVSVINFTRELESNKAFLASVTGGSMSSVKVFPQFWPTLLIVSICGFLAWVIVVIVFYAVRDRK